MFGCCIGSLGTALVLPPADHKAPSPAVQPRFSPPACAFIQTVLHPSVSKDGTVLDSARSLTKVKMNSILCTIHLSYRRLPGLLGIISPFHNQCWALPVTFCPKWAWKWVPGHLFHCLPWDQGEADWSVTLRVSFLSSLKICVTFALFQKAFPFSDSWEWPHRDLSQLPHECIPSAPMDFYIHLLWAHPKLTFFHWGWVFPASDFLTGPTGIAGGWFYQERRSWRVQRAPWPPLCPLSPRSPHSAADPHFICDTLAEALFVALPRPCLIRHQLGSDFSSPSPTFAWVAGVYSGEHTWSLCLEPITNSMYQPQK